jgi:hypothetical protein
VQEPEDFGPEPVVGPIRGYRWWLVDREGWLRSPWFGRTRWAPEGTVATCLATGRWFRHRWDRRHPKGAPSRDCDCGLYGLHGVPQPEPGQALRPWRQSVSAIAGEGRCAFGVAEAWGRVLLGTEGWRAEHARPIALYINPMSSMARAPSLKAMSERYAVPVVRDLDALVGEWGPLADDDLLRIPPDLEETA